ncbi:hypothetical protein AB0J55_26675 [Amycolatopsis sp. NPDC049688]|uniref:hypothetical protein n=1 Tax=Amycolatopsis sp. NPDC049688 TaxID=3154733 RepID=UPI0034146FD2
MISVHYYNSPWDFAGEENGIITQRGKGYRAVVGEYGSIDKWAADPANNRYRADFAHAVVATPRSTGLRPSTVTHQGIIDAIMTGAAGR